MDLLKLICLWSSFVDLKYLKQWRKEGVRSILKSTCLRNQKEGEKAKTRQGVYCKEWMEQNSHRSVKCEMSCYYTANGTVYTVSSTTPGSKW